MQKKFELTDESIQIFCGTTLFRIRALRSFSDIIAGECGGYVESENNLSHQGDSWVYDEAMVWNEAKIFDDAKIRGKARIYNYAWVFGRAIVHDSATIFSTARVMDKSFIGDTARIANSTVKGSARIVGKTLLYGDSVVDDDACIYNNSRVVWVGNVGASNMTLTAFLTNHDVIKVTYAGLTCTIDQFMDAHQKLIVNFEQEFAQLFQYIRVRLHNTIIRDSRSFSPEKLILQ